MNDAISGLPLWFQYLWGIAGMGVVILALIWTIGIFWPYLRRTERKMDESIKLAKETSGVLETFQNDLKPVITDLRDAVGDVKEIVRDVKDRDLDTVRDTLEQLRKELEKGGLITRIQSDMDRIAESIEKFTNGGMEDKVLEQVDKRLGDIL